jgi:outer membrane biosynthesis protein TonB
MLVDPLAPFLLSFTENPPMVGFLKKLTGKGENFYLEIKDDDQPSAPLTPKAKEPEPAAPAPIVSEPEPAAAPAPTVAEPKPAAAPVAAAPAPVAPKPAPQPDVTFAPDYLLSLKTFSKRRPGPSMAKFMTLAQQMKR